MKLFSRFRKRTPETNDMRETPIDNPLDYREDGSIHPGDPAYAALTEVLESDEAVLFTQRKDGTWKRQR